MRRTVLDRKVIVGGPPALHRFLDARAAGAPRGELLELKLAAAMSPERAEEIAAKNRAAARAHGQG